ncbi:trehalase, putative, partial [Bodo saltans]
MAEEATDYSPSKTLLAEVSSNERFAHRRFAVLGVAFCTVCLAAMATLMILYHNLDDGNGSPSTSLLRSCTHPIYCTGEFLQAVQLAQPALFPDSKTFVDMPCRSPPQAILDAFQAQKNSAGFNISAFVQQHFDAAGSEVMTVTPPDFVPNPQRLSKLQNVELRTFAYNVHAVWKNLTRQFNTSYSCGEPCMSSMPVPNPFVAPGGRFREFYYWDTYWIIKGLLVSNLTVTARHTLDNLLWAVKEYGFVPNGARIYYQDRSQPPLLTLMVRDYVTATGDLSILTDAIDLLHQEHQFWMLTPHRVRTSDTTITANPTITSDDVLNRYYAVTADPRPESYREDTATLQSSNGRSPLDMYSSLATGAETGWDYSTRWFANNSEDITAVNAQNVVPIDLNAILLQVESTMKNWTCAGGLAPNPSLCTEYGNWVSSRTKSVVKVFPASPVMGDFLLDVQLKNTKWFGAVSALLASPEYANAVNLADLQGAVNTLVTNIYPGGVPASLTTSGQQWDFP